MADNNGASPLKNGGRFFQLSPLNTGHVLILITMFGTAISVGYGLRAQVDQNSVAIKLGAERDDALRDQMRLFAAELRRLEIEERLEREKVIVRFEARGEQATAGQAVIIQRIAVLESQLIEARQEIRRLLERIERGPQPGK